MLSDSQKNSIIDYALSRAEGYEAEILLTEGARALTRFGENVITQNVVAEDVELTIRVQRDGRMARCTSGDITPEGIDRCIHAGRRALEISPKNPDLIELPMPQDHLPNSAWFDDALSLGPEQRAEAVGKAVTACRSEGLNGAGIFSNSGSSLTVANSRGVRAAHRWTEVNFSLSAMAADSSGWAQSPDASAAGVKVDEVVKSAVEKALLGRNPIAVEPGAWTVIFEPAAVADFLLFLGWEAFNGLAFAEGRSSFSGKTGRRVAGENITLCDDAFHPLTIGMPFDFEGVPRQRVTLIEKGVFTSAVHDRRTGGLVGAASTGHALPQPDVNGPVPLNLVMEGGDATLKDMIESTQNGLLVTRLHYTNILDPMKLTITGMTRDGLFLIESGRVTRGVKNMRFTESILHILSNVEALSRELSKTETFWGGGGTVAPAIKVNDFHFTSQTEN